jgi:glycosyltransferase involved in cell wall biosynthesis
MNHLIICGEFPPAPSGGIGTYAVNMSRLLAEAGETVHVISRQWEGAESARTEDIDGRLIVHRVPFEDWAALRAHRPHRALRGRVERALFGSEYPPQCFAWSAAAVAERLVAEEGIDVVEAQEYEAPLYFFQLRRALGQGPPRQPPCLVHLHSPTELIARSNEWDRGRPDVLTATRLEAFSIAAADAVLCPSGYLARQAEHRYNLGTGSVSTIPYPLGHAPALPRDEPTWARGAVCFVGRLEPRKGVFEWVQAAVEAARDRPEVLFEFLGGDTWIGGRSVRAMLQRSIPRTMRRQFLFRGEQPRAALPRFLERARIGVVPSRWDNFPNACMELMASGLPVVATREGGMAEMIADGQSGWLARQAGAAGLAEALRRALATPPAALAEMGCRAERDIRKQCNNDRIVEAHLELRRTLAATGAARSRRWPARHPACASPRATARWQSPAAPATRGVAVIVLCRQGDRGTEQTLRDLNGQTRQPAAIAVAATDASAALARRAAPKDLHQNCPPEAPTWRESLGSLVAMADRPLGVALVDAGVRLEPGFLAAAEAVLRVGAGVGLVACWAAIDQHPARIWARPSPSLPDQLLVNDVGPCPVLRTEALAEVLPSIDRGASYSDWALCNRVLAAGWQGVTMPSVLARASARRLAQPGPVDARLLDRAVEACRRAGSDFAATPLGAERGRARGARRAIAELGRQLVAAGTLARTPRSTASKLLRRLRSKVLRRLRDRSAASPSPSPAAVAPPPA